MADACGIDNKDAMFRRFTNTCGAHCIPDKKTARDKMTEHLIKVITKNVEHHMDINIDKLSS